MMPVTRAAFEITAGFVDETDLRQNKYVRDIGVGGTFPL
jgi:hypothetical protein